MNDRVTLNFGKHKGKSLEDIPVEYLDWLIGQDWLKSDIKELITKHLKSRPEWQALDDD